MPSEEDILFTDLESQPPAPWNEETPIDDILTSDGTSPSGDDATLVDTEILQAEALIMLTNIAEKQSQDVLSDLATKVLEGYKTDLSTRASWEELNTQIIDLAKLLVKKKTYAGDPVANVKYPLITNACIQFAARAYPEMIKGNDVVKGKVIGQDTGNLKFDKAQRIAEFMSYQVLHKMLDWEDGVDQLLFTLPAIGCAFKKTYYNSIEKRNESQLVFADDLIVNYFAESIERAPRITHRIYLYPNEIVERITSGVFSPFDPAELGEATSDDGAATDEETPHLFLEQHRWYDLDGDGYQEPYIITIHEQTQKLVRIAARFASDGIIRNDAGSIIKIVPEVYFTRYLFMPALDGGFYGMGFGSLLMSTNSAVNTVINQLLDSGTLSNRQSGFLGRGLRLGRGKSLKVGVGEWKPVESTGDDLRKNIFPMPVREPSNVLFQLLGMMIEASKELSGMTEILSGQSPGANVPAESVLALIEQGLQVYSAIHKRIHRAQYKEFKKLQRLNALYLDQMDYTNILDDQEAIVQTDFSQTSYDIIPVSDPNSTTMMQRLLKAKALLEMRGQGLNDQEIIKRYLLALDVDNIEQLMPDKQEQADPAEDLSMQKLQLEMQELQVKMQKLSAETQLILAKVDTERSSQAKTTSGIVNDGRKLNLAEGQAAHQMDMNFAKTAQDETKLSMEGLRSFGQPDGLKTNNQTKE